MIGALSLSNKQGVFLGSVNLENLNLEPNQLVYSTDGINMTGLDLGTGLVQNGTVIETSGNPDIGLTSNSIYVNDGQKSIQTAVDDSSQADVIYISSGSYGEAQVTFSTQYNIALLGPPVGTVANTLCEVLNGFNIPQGSTVDLVRFANLQIKGSTSEFSGVGRTKLSNCVFTGTALQQNTITFGSGSNKFITVIDCEFDQYCSIVIPATFTSVIYFINCGFNSATFSLSNVSNLQVIFNNCSGFSTFPSTTKATFVGLNVLTTGQSQVNTYDLKTTLINGSAYPPTSGGVSVTNQAVTLVPFCSSTSNTLTCDADFNFTTGTNTLAVPNLTVTNVNGNVPLQATSQAVNRVITATATTGTIHCNQDLIWDGEELELFNSNPLKIGRGNNSTSSHTNTAIGVNALGSITSGTGNTVLGHNLEAISTQSNNCIIGYNNGANLTAVGTHSNIVLVGSNSNIGADSTANGVCVGIGSKVGSTSVAIGNSIDSNTGGNSVCIGHQAGRQQNLGSNTIVGSSCGTSVTNGTSNTIVGYFSEFTTNPTYAVTLGAQAGSNGGLGNIAIGYGSKANGKLGANSSLCIGYLSQTGTTYNNVAVIGNNIASASITANGQFQLGNSTQTIQVQNPITVISDARDKLDIKDAELGLEFIQKLKPRMWRNNPRSAYCESVTDENGVPNWKQIPNDGSKSGRRFHYGLVAQELKTILDEMGVDFVGLKDTSVTGNGNGDFTIAYGEFFGVFIKAFQELTEKNNQLEARIKALELK